MDKASVKRKIAHETREMIVIVLFLAPFFLSFSTFKMYVTHDLRNAFFNYGLALFNALVLAKIILIGELARLGKSSENKPLIVPTLHKAAIFSLLYLVFHAFEIGVRGWFHRTGFVAALFDESITHRGEFAATGLMLFFGFIPFFAMREMRRIIGEDKFIDMFLGSRHLPASDHVAVAGEKLA